MTTTANPPVANKKSGPATPVPDPYRDPVGYLKAKNWRCDGDPYHPTARWFDPTKPPKETIERKVLGIRHDANGRPMIRDGKPIENVQHIVHPAAWPMTRGEAIEIQTQRDDAERTAE